MEEKVGVEELRERRESTGGGEEMVVVGWDDKVQDREEAAERRRGRTGRRRRRVLESICMDFKRFCSISLGRGGVSCNSFMCKSKGNPFAGCWNSAGCFLTHN
jgi:hypothetical protein